MKKKRRKKEKQTNIKKKFFYKDDIFISRMSSILKLPHPKTKELFYQRIVSSIRINNLLVEPNKAVQLLRKKGLELQEVEWSDYTYIVKNRDKSELSKMPEYDKCLFYIQNLSSMIPPIVLNPQPEDTILDMCAAPGSKTTQLASLMNNQGQIVANDNDYKRAQKLSKILEKFNVQNTQVNFSQAENLGRKFENYFDKVLLDAPCSGEGMIYLGKKRPLKFWNIKKSQEIAKLQKKMILSAYSCLKPGGTLIYSTCSLSPNENESVVTYLLDNHKNAKLQDIELINSKNFEKYKSFANRGLKEWNQEIYHPDIQKTVRIVPGKTMIGFYLALIKKD